jgi:radical SAM protein with 4Fe4S-binding SPASM domain
MLNSKPYIIYSFRILSTLNFKKIKNLIVLYFSLLISKAGLYVRPSSKPVFISVEPANFCQLQCPECPVGTKSNGRKNNETMENKLFAEILDELKSHLMHIIFYFQGEPLLDPMLDKKIALAHKAKIFTSLSTNAQILNKNYAEKLVKAGLDKIIISIDGATQETYEKYRVGGKLEKALNAIDYLQVTKKELKSATPIVELQFIVFGTNQHEMKEIKNIAKKHKVDVLKFKSAQIYDYQNGHPLMTSIEKYARYKKNKQGKYELKHKLHNSCERSWMGAVISSKGQLLACCFDKHEKHSFGSIENQSIVNTWNNRKATIFRQSILENRKQFEMCRNCTEK